MTTTTEKYIQKAVQEAKKELSGATIQNCMFETNVDVGQAAENLAKAMLKQAEANSMNSEAMLELAKRLTPDSIHAINISNNRIGCPSLDD